MTMTRQFCSKINANAWANSSKSGPRCTACGQFHTGGPVILAPKK